MKKEKYKYDKQVYRRDHSVYLQKPKHRVCNESTSKLAHATLIYVISDPPSINDFIRAA